MKHPTLNTEHPAVRAAVDLLSLAAIEQSRALNPELPEERVIHGAIVLLEEAADKILAGDEPENG